MNRLNKIMLLAFFFVLAWALPASGQEIKRLRVTELETLIRESNKPLIINFWATWCKPCVEELPYFQQLAAGNDVSLLLVSLDLEEALPKELPAFISKRKITAPVVWLNETNADYFCPKIDTAWSGAIPASLFINNITGYRKFIPDQLSKENLETEIRSLLWRPQ